MKDKNGEPLLILVAYVDDCLLINPKEQRDLREKFVKDFNAKYEITDEGDLSLHLGVNYVRDRTRGTLHCSQSAYIAAILDKFGMTNCNPVNTPLPPNVKTYKSTPEDALGESDHALYRSIVGSLQYLATMTRADLAFATSELSRYLSAPSKTHLQLAKHVLAYLKGTPDRGLTFKTGGDEILSGYSDATWANDPETRRSVSGYVFLLNGTAVSWKSKLEHTVALSSSESEYQAIARAAQEASYLRQLLKELGAPQLSPTTIFEDNEGCIAM
eukprot:540673-Rhodomonas_salina.1